MRAAAYFGLDAVADEIVARVAPAIGDDFAHITGDVAHRIAHRVQIRFVQQVMLPCHDPGGVLMRKVAEVAEDRHREGRGEVPDEVALALVLEAGNMVQGGLTPLVFTCAHAGRRHTWLETRSKTGVEGQTTLG